MPNPQHYNLHETGERVVAWGEVFRIAGVATDTEGEPVTYALLPVSGPVNVEPLYASADFVS